jgi:hypothetical protein
MRGVPSSINTFFFWGGATRQFDWSITQKENESMEAPQKRRLYIEVLSSSEISLPKRFGTILGWTNSPCSKKLP